MPDDPKDETPPSEDLPEATPAETHPARSALPAPPPVEEFPEKLGCPQCRRMFPVKSLRAKANTLLTEAALVCPRCRRKLRRMKLKDWYDHYVQGQEKDFKLDTHGFVHTDPPGEGLNAPQEQGPRDHRPQQQQQFQNRRGGGPNRGRDNRQNQQRGGQPNQKKSLLPQNVRAYRLPKKRRSR